MQQTRNTQLSSKILNYFDSEGCVKLKNFTIPSKNDRQRHQCFKTKTMTNTFIRSIFEFTVFFYKYVPYSFGLKISSRTAFFITSNSNLVKCVTERIQNIILNIMYVVFLFSIIKIMIHIVVSLFVMWFF